jgi:hypothetical protein
MFLKVRALLSARPAPRTTHVIGSSASTTGKPVLWRNTTSSPRSMLPPPVSTLQRIETATGKSITREPERFRAGVVPEVYDEGQQEWDAEDPLEEAAS